MPKVWHSRPAFGNSRFVEAMDAAENPEEHKVVQIMRDFRARITYTSGAVKSHEDVISTIEGEPEERELIAYMLSLADDISRVCMVSNIQVLRVSRDGPIVLPQKSDIPPFLLRRDRIYSVINPGPHVHHPKKGFYWGGFRDGIIAAAKVAAKKAALAEKLAASWRVVSQKRPLPQDGRDPKDGHGRDPKDDRCPKMAATAQRQLRTLPQRQPRTLP